MFRDSLLHACRIQVQDVSAFADLGPSQLSSLQAIVLQAIAAPLRPHLTLHCMLSINLRVEDLVGPCDCIKNFDARKHNGMFQYITSLIT